MCAHYCADKQFNFNFIFHSVAEFRVFLEWYLSALHGTARHYSQQHWIAHFLVCLFAFFLSLSFLHLSIHPVPLRSILIFICFVFGCKKGDALITTCYYDTRGYTNTTLGGFSISDEMCVNYIQYYPATQLEVCKSSVSEKTLEDYFFYMKRYLCHLLHTTLYML